MDGRARTKNESTMACRCCGASRCDACEGTACMWGTEVRWPMWRRWVRDDDEGGKRRLFVV